MERVSPIHIQALREALATQPITDPKLGFAWAVAAGPTLARATRVSWGNGIVTVRVPSQAWQREVARARPDLLARLNLLLAPDTARSLRIIVEDTHHAIGSHR